MATKYGRNSMQGGCADPVRDAKKTSGLYRGIDRSNPRNYGLVLRMWRTGICDAEISA